MALALASRCIARHASSSSITQTLLQRFVSGTACEEMYVDWPGNDDGKGLHGTTVVEPTPGDDDEPSGPPAPPAHRPHLPRTCPSHAPPTIHHRHHCREKTAEDVANPSSSSEAFTTLTEGRATILTQGNNEAFYNPAQVVNRDLSIAVINHFQKVRATETMVLSHKQRRWVYCGGYPIRRRRTPTHARH